ncbi:ATP-binding protein [Actinosynnema pretiosum]|uniref:AAA family ATPase n=1 Tax=Actinosynnema pretiosum TaxID=42197 RepID=A0A290Z2Q5_9PSEU|nr:ATP-binding protein [Actinosynnema pretiosum]ATE53274.1 AAA family ATPase [Actinosynnema pretiosum]
MTDHLTVLSRLSLNWAETPDHVWRDSPYHVEGLQDKASMTLDGCVKDAESSDGPSPIGLVLQGQKGIGKTHLLGLARRKVHEVSGYFFLNDLTDGDAFWENTVEALRTGLSCVDNSGGLQLISFLRRLCSLMALPSDVSSGVLGGRRLTRKHVDAFVEGLYGLDRRLAMECGDTARALVLCASQKSAVRYVGDHYLGGFEEEESGERRKWGIRAQRKPSLALVRDITRLLALTGPIVIGVDQLDTLVARSGRTMAQTGDADSDDYLMAQIADGLMRLREVTRRTVTVLMCLPSTWAGLKAKASDTVPDRFREEITLGDINDPRLGSALVEKRLGVAYRNQGFTPPYPTWPIRPSAFEENWEPHTPRGLIKRLGAHIDTCLREGQVFELDSLNEFAPLLPESVDQAPKPATTSDQFAELDALYDRLRAKADCSFLLDPKNEDEVMPELLSGALRAWISEVGSDNMEWERKPGTSGNELHAWLTWNVDEKTDLQEHWAFRVILAKHHISVLHRFRQAKSAARQTKKADNRHLVVIRASAWSPGIKTQQELAEFEAAGGLKVKLSDADVRTFWALQQMTEAGHAEYQDWLIERRPAGKSQLLSSALSKALTTHRAATPRAPASRRKAGPAKNPAADRSDGTHPPPDPDAITVGTTLVGGAPVQVELAALRKHTAVFAGSGSGKTVLLRRIVEECALRGVSSIVLDPNNDLARLGDAWPDAPEGWAPGDAALAGRYLAGTDVVVWTPGWASGRPLAFQPLPDFAVADGDEFTAAVEVAVAALAPQAKLTGGTARTSIGLAVLRGAVERHARTGSRSVRGLIALLADLPEGVTDINDGRKIAADLAEVLKAAVVNDPLFAGEGHPVAPGALLTPADGKRARISVINLMGLPSDEQRQSFVNQLQMELFSWIKRNPAGERPLGGLFVVDEAQNFAPSGTMLASTRSTIALASQARKYGLGLVFATQAPKGLHNQVVGNSTTQFFGRLNSPVQINAATELARAKGSSVADISRLERAQFYVSGEAFGFRKVATPLCLSHHPASPLHSEEVLQRARAGDGGRGA